MRINPDGTIDITDPEEIKLYLEHTTPKPVEVPLAEVLAGTALSRVSEAAETAYAEAQMNGSAVADTQSAVAVLERPETEREVVVMPVDKVMPKHVELPPLVPVTQAQQLVVELLRHYPLGLTTKDIAAKLRWEHSKATHTVSYLHRNESGLIAPIIEKLSGTKIYRLTEFGRKARYEIKAQPSRYRMHRR